MRSLCAPSRWSSAGIQTQRRAALLSVLFGCLACVSKCYQHPLPHSLSLSAEDFTLRISSQQQHTLPTQRVRTPCDGQPIGLKMRSSPPRTISLSVAALPRTLYVLCGFLLRSLIRRKKKCLHWRSKFGIIHRVFRSLPHGVTVAQLTLDQFVKVRILVRQPVERLWGALRGLFCC